MCESVLHVLDSRAMEVYDVHMLAYKIQTLLERMKEHEYETDAEFMYEISDDVEHIQHHLQEVFMQEEEEYELYERGIVNELSRLEDIHSRHYLIRIMH